MGEIEGLISELSDPTFAFIKDIFKKRQQGKLNEKELAPYVEVVREFYANYEPFHLDDYSITSIIRDQTLKFSPTVIKKLYELHEIIDPDFPYKKIGALQRLR